MENNSRAKLKISRRKLFRLFFCGTPATALGYALLAEPEWIAVRQVRVQSLAMPLTGKAPTRKFRLIHFTDLHHKGDRAYLEKIVRTINRLQADAVCFTGDLIEEAEFLPETLELLRTVNRPMYGVPGNHDYWADCDFDAVAEAFAATGGKWLMDQVADLPEAGLRIIGATCGKDLLHEPAAGLKNILLMHYPSWVEKLGHHKFDLILAGHSHGGQVRIPFYGALLVPFGVGEFDLGLYQTPSGPLYVNPGLGYFYLNVRFCCRPEITVFDFVV